MRGARAPLALTLGFIPGRHGQETVADLAWCEWIVRMHHPGHVDALDALFDGYETRPSWPRRHAAMLARCRELLDLTHRREPEGAGERSWRRRIEVTTGWRERSNS